MEEKTQWVKDPDHGFIWNTIDHLLYWREHREKHCVSRKKYMRLCILGAFGAHQFYAKRPVLGLLGRKGKHPMDNVMQFLFNTNHEQPSILVWILLIVIAVVIPNYVRYRMEQKRSNDSVPTQNPARSAPRKKKRSKKR